MGLSLRVVRVSVDPEHLQDSANRLGALPGIKLGLGHPASPLKGMVPRLKLVQPPKKAARHKPRLTTTDLAMTFPLEPEVKALVLVTPAMDELVAACVLTLRYMQCSHTGNWDDSDIRTLLTVEGRIRLGQVIAVLHHGMTNRLAIPAVHRPDITPLEALYYSCGNPSITIRSHIGRIRDYLTTPSGAFEGWQAEAVAGRNRTSMPALAV